MRGQVKKRGNSWTVRVYGGLDPDSGKRRYINRTVHGTKKEAEQVRVALLRQLDQGELLLTPTRLTLVEYLGEWLEKAARPRVRARTFDDYEGLLRRYVIPVLGEKRLSALTPLDLQGVVSGMLGRGLAPRTVRYSHVVLRNALQQAVKWRLISHNPAQGVELPKHEHVEMLAMSQEESQRFLAAAAASKHHLLFALLLATGLRPGEAVALRWSDFDVVGRSISVNRSASFTRRGLRLEPPKTRRSRRTVELPEHLVGRLLDRRGDAAAEAYIFPSKVGTPLDPRNLAAKYFKPILAAAGLPRALRVYDLRHTHATLLLAAGVNPKIVSERHGHASVALTLDRYSHVLPGMQADSARKLDAMLFSSTPEPRARGDLAN